jgi:membrane protease YdiL (CAAX protease family)
VSAPRDLFPLDGAVEQPYPQSRATAMGWGVLVLVVAFVVYQLVGFVAIVAFSVLDGTGLQMMVIQMQQGAFENATALLGANAIGQVVGLGVLAWVAARLHTSAPDAFLSMRRPPPVVPLLLAALAVGCLMPVVQAVGEWNASLPLPDALRQLEEQQMALIEQVLGSSASVWINLVLLALTPALFEELMFRGYFQRQAERAVGHRWGIFLSGLLFGVFHLRFSQIVSLVLLGCVLAYVVWRTRSVWTGVLVHLLYNGSLVVLAASVDDPAQALELPGYLFWLGLIGAVALMIWLHRSTARPPERAVEAPARTLPAHP